MSGTATHPDNPVASTRGVGYQFMRDRTFMANLTLKEKLDFITPGLYLQEAISFSTWTRGTYTMSRNYSRLIGGEAQTAHLNENYSVSDDKGTNQWSWNQLRFQLGYDRTFGQHSITAAAAYEQYHKYVDASLNGNAGVQTHFAHQAINARANYSYAGKYVAEAGLSWCGSDNYAKGNRFRVYPYASLAWNAHNESFLKGSEIVNLLKVRASVGTTGYDYFAGGRYLYNQYYVAGNSFPTNNSGSPTYNNSLIPAFLAEKGITSETALKYNIGADVKLFNSLQMTLDLYREDRSGIITQDNSYAAGLGVTPPYRNVGKTMTQGEELALSYLKTFGDFTIGAGGMISYLSDKINYMAEIPPASPYAALTGKNIGALIGYESDGFYDITDFDADGNLLSSLPSPQFGKVQPGDIRYKNQNNDNVIDERDKVSIGLAVALVQVVVVGFQVVGCRCSLQNVGLAGLKETCQRIVEQRELVQLILVEFFLHGLEIGKQLFGADVLLAERLEQHCCRVHTHNASHNLLMYRRRFGHILHKTRNLFPSTAVGVFLKALLLFGVAAAVEHFGVGAYELYNALVKPRAFGPKQPLVGRWAEGIDVEARHKCRVEVGQLVLVAVVTGRYYAASLGQGPSGKLAVEHKVHHRLQNLGACAVEFIEEQHNGLAVDGEPVGWHKGCLARCLVLCGKSQQIAGVTHLS